MGKKSIYNSLSLNMYVIKGFYKRLLCFKKWEN